jgi:protein TonB
LPVPTVSLPDIALSTAGRQMTAGDFSSAGVMPTAGDESVTSTPSFTPRTVEPQLRNRTAVQKALAENYPRVLRERHIGGTVRLWVLIDSVGRVIRSELHQTSGNDFLDKAAIKVADVMQFTPAMNRDRKVSVWVLLPINFKTQQ